MGFRVVAPAGERLINLAQDFAAALGVGTSNDPVGVKKIRHGGAFPQKLRVRGHIKGIRFGAIPQHNLANPAAGVNRDGALLDDQFIARNRPRNVSRHGFHVRQIGVALLGRGGSHCDEYSFAITGGNGQITGKLQASATVPGQQFGQELLVNGNFAALERCQFGAVVVHQDDCVAEVG